VLYCRVKRAHLARFTHAAQAHLLDALELIGEQACLVIEGQEYPIALDPLAIDSPERP